MQAIVFLCRKSLILREKRQRKIEEAVVDKNCEKGVIYDDEEEDIGVLNDELDVDDSEDDQWNPDEDFEDEMQMYDTKLDKVDDVLFVRDQLVELEKSNATHYINVINCLSGDEKQQLMEMFATA